MNAAEIATKDDITRLAEAIAALRADLAAVTIRAEPEWLSIPEAARRLGVTPRTIRNRIERGEIQATGAGAGRKVRITT